MVNNPSSWVINGWFTIPFWAKTDGTRRRHRGKRGTRWIRALHVAAKKEAAAVNVAAVLGVMVTALKKKHSIIITLYYSKITYVYIYVYNYIITHIMPYIKKKTNYLLLVCNINFCLVVHSLNLVIFNFMNWIREKIRIHNIIIDSIFISSP